jgi:hypothetical protein
VRFTLPSFPQRSEGILCHRPSPSASWQPPRAVCRRPVAAG